MASAAEQRLVVAAARRDPAILGWLLGWRPAAVHFRFHAHLQAPRRRGTAVARLHRGIGKTTQVANAIAWEIGNAPSVRIKYVAQTDDEATKTTRLVRAIMDRPEYRAVFPEVRIDPRERSGHRFTVEVAGRAARDATLEAHGIFGRAGGRFDLLVVDDACDLRNSVQQPALREQVKEAFWNIWRPMADRSAKRPPRIWVVGTPWHVDDLLADLAAKYPADLLHEPVVGNRSPWPEVFDDDAIQSLRDDMPAAAFARAYELTPVSGEDLVFPEAWVKPCCRLEPPEAPGYHRIGTIDWGFTERKRDGDPDYSVLLVGDRNPDGIVVLRRMLRMRADYPTFRDLAVAETARLGVRTIYAEANGPQKGLVQDLQRHAKCAVAPLNRATDKVTRASEVQPIVRAGRVVIPSVHPGEVSAEFRALYDEVTTFPYAAHDDTVDAFVDLLASASTGTPKHRPSTVGYKHARASRHQRQRGPEGNQR